MTNGRQIPSFVTYGFVLSCPWNQFHQILHNIHVVDNNTNAPSYTDPGYDKLWKVHPLLNVCAESAPQLYGLH